MKGFLSGILSGTALGGVALGVVSLVVEPPARPIDTLRDQETPQSSQQEASLEQAGTELAENTAESAGSELDSAGSTTGDYTDDSESDSIGGQTAPKLRPAPQDRQAKTDEISSDEVLENVATVESDEPDESVELAREQATEQAIGQGVEAEIEAVAEELFPLPVVDAAIPQQPSVPKGPEAEHSDPEFGVALIEVEDEPAPRVQDEGLGVVDQDLTAESVPTAEVNVPVVAQSEPIPSEEENNADVRAEEVVQETEILVTPVFIDGEDVVASTLEGADSLALSSDGTEVGAEVEVAVVGEYGGIATDDEQRLTAAQVKINRPGADEREVAPVEPVATPQGRQALQRFAVAPPQSRGLPRFAIALVPAQSGASIGLEDLAQAGVTVSVLLNPEAQDAGARMADYRAAGVEVGVYAALPKGAKASDLAVYFEAALSTLPETTVLVPQGFQASPSLNEELLAIAQKDGHGLLFAANGLNSIIRDAQKSDVPARTFYRYLQDETASAQTLARFLEQASFRAQRQDGIIVLGRATPEMFEALSLWAQSRRAQSVDAVPLSAMFISAP